MKNSRRIERFVSLVVIFSIILGNMAVSLSLETQTVKANASNSAVADTVVLDHEAFAVDVKSPDESIQKVSFTVPDFVASTKIPAVTSSLPVTTFETTTVTTAPSVLTSTVVFLPVVYKNWQRIQMPGLSFVPPAGWQSPAAPSVPITATNDITGTEAMRLVSPSGAYFMDVTIDWFAPPATDDIFGNFAMPSSDDYEETVYQLQTSELVQVMRVTGPVSGSLSLLAHAAFSTDRASYALGLYGEMLDGQLWEDFFHVVASLTPNSATLPESIVLNDSEIEVVAGSTSSYSPFASVQAVSYDRDDAKRYATTFVNQFDNSDDCYLWYNGASLRCSYLEGYWGVDGAHFINRALRSGGLHIPGLWDGEALRVKDLREWVLDHGGQDIDNVRDLKKGDIVFYGTGSCWGWAGLVVETGSRPKVALHSVVNGYNTQPGMIANYDSITRNACGWTNRHSYVHINTVQDQPAPLIAQSLTRSPSTPFVGQSVQTTFRVCNYGGAAFDTNSLYVRTSSPGTHFPSVNPPSLSPGNPGGCYNYNRTAAPFPAAGWYTIKAGYNDGGFRTLDTVSGKVNQQTMYVASPDDIELQGEMTVSPEVIQQGDTASVQFTVKNTGAGTVTDRFRVRIYDENYPDPGSLVAEFPASGDVSLAPNATYTYNNSRVLDTPGIYWIAGEHWAGGNWQPVYGDSVKPLRVMYPLPSKPKLAKGMPPYIALAGEPVNTGTGNFVHEHTDLVIPLPGLSFDVTRYHNHIDANEVTGDFGPGWTWTLGWRISWRDDKSAVLTYPDGREAYLIGELDPDDLFNLSGTYVGHFAETQTIVRAEDGTATIEGKDQRRYEFDAAGRLVRVRDGAGNGLDITRNAAGHIERITHTAGAIYDFAYTGDYITTITSSDGYSLNYEYSPSGDLVRVTSTAGDTFEYTYDDQHRMTTITDALGNRILLNEYDDQNRVARQTDASDVRSTFDYVADDTAVFYDQLGIPVTHTYDSDLRVIRIENARGAVTEYEYDEDYNRIKKTNPLGEVWRWAYDEHGRVISSTNPLGATWIYTRDVRGNVLEERNPLGYVQLREYDEHDNLIREVDAEGGQTLREYDGRGLLIREIDPISATREFTYTVQGLLSAITDSVGGSTMAYDAYGNRVSYIDAEGRITYSAFDDAGRAISKTGPLGNVITFTHDVNGNLLAESDGDGHVRTMGYDEQDRLITRTDYLGHLWRVEYDALGRVVREENPMGGFVTYTYDVAGNVIVKRDERGGIWRYEYDLDNNKVLEVDPLGNETRYVYNAAGQRVIIDRPCESCSGGRTVEHIEYDLAGRIIKRIDGRGNATEYKYDRVGRVIEEIDALGHSTKYKYNARGDKIEIIDALNHSTYREYNEVGWLITTTNRLGYQTVRSYDKVGKLLSVRDARGNTTSYRYDAADNVILEIDALGNETYYEYDLRGNVLTETNALGQVTTHNYDANGQRTSTTNPRGFTTYNAYDALGHRVTVTDPLGIVLQRVYDAAGDLRREIDGEGQVTSYDYDLLGRRSVITDARGAVTYREYNADGYLAVVIDPLGTQTRYFYDANGNKIKEVKAIPVGGTEEDGQTSIWVYDPLNRVKYFFDALAHRTEYCYDELGRLVRTIGPRGEVNNWMYDDESQNTRWEDALGNATEYAYDEVGNQIVITNARGFATQTVYDALNRPVQVINALGDAIYYEYNAVGDKIVFTDTRGAATHYEYDTNHNPITVTNPISGELVTVYNANDWPIAQRDAAGYWKYTEYDRNGRVIVLTDTLGHVTQYERDANGNVIQQTDPLSRTTVTEYDALNRPIMVTDTLGYAKMSAYDAAGNVVERRDERGNVWHTAYDQLNRAITITDPLTGTVVLGYDEVGNVITRTDQAGNVTTYKYNVLDQLKREVDPLGNAILYSYDEMGNLTRRVDKRWTPTCYAYDALGRRIRTIAGSSDCAQDSPHWPTTLYEYDSAGNLTAWRDANGHWIHRAYDDVGQMISETNALGVTTVYTYSLNGLLVAKRDGNGNVITYTYDSAGRHITTHYPDGRTVEFAYDAAGNRVAMRDWNGEWTFAHDDLNRLAAATDPFSHTLGYEYDEAGNPSRIIYPHGQSVTMTYDARNDLATWTDFAGDTIQFTYDSRGLLQEQVNPNDTVTRYGYDSVGQLTDLVNGKRLPGEPAVIQIQSAYTYTLDGGGNRTQVTEDRVNFAQLHSLTNTLTLTRAYSYDVLSRLTRADVTLPYTDTPVSTMYDFDQVGNRQAKEGSELVSDHDVPALPVSAQPVTSSYQYNAANQLLSNGEKEYRYDHNGNRVLELQPLSDSTLHVRQMTYDYDNHLIHVAEFISDTTPVSGTEAFSSTVTTLQAVSYTYDGLGRRIKEVVTVGEGLTPTHVITYLYSQATLIGTEVKDSGIVTTTYYGRAAGGKVLEVMRLPNPDTDFAGDRHWVQTDGSGSIVGLTAMDGRLTDVRLYGDYGDLLVGELELTTLAYTGQEYDTATGYHHFLYRDYDAVTGIWTTPDPYRGHVYDPVSQHRYQYVRNNPATLVDPLGLFDWQTSAVEWGDTWESIATQWGTSAGTLRRLNPWIDELHVGDYLQLPECRSAQCQLQLGITEVRIGGMSGTACGQRIIERQKAWLVELAARKKWRDKIAEELGIKAPSGLNSEELKRFYENKLAELEEAAKQIQIWNSQQYNCGPNMCCMLPSPFTSSYNPYNYDSINNGFFNYDYGYNSLNYALYGSLPNYSSLYYYSTLSYGMGSSSSYGTSSGSSYWGSAFEQALLGEFYEGDPTLAGTVGEIGIGFIPIVGQIADARDTAGAIKKLYEDPSWGNVGNLGLNLVAWVPGVGDGIKGLGKAGENLKYADETVGFFKHSDEVSTVSKNSSEFFGSFKYSNDMKYTKRWSVGDPVNLPTKNGYPSWTTSRNRFWKNEALSNPDNYSPANLGRMKKGAAPQRINPITGKLESMELHHMKGRNIYDPHNESNLLKVWPDEHAVIDPYRNTGN